MEITVEQETIFNPITSEKLLVLESTEEVFRMCFSINPHSEIAGEHFHPFHEQTVTVTAGELHCRVDGVNCVLRAGDSVKIPAGSRHFQSNPTDTKAWAIEEYRPARQMHNFFRVLFTLAQEGETDFRGMPKPLVGAALIAEFKDSVRPSALRWRLIFGLLAPLSRLLGYRKMIRRYIERFENTESRASVSHSNSITNPVQMKNV